MFPESGRRVGASPRLSPRTGWNCLMCSSSTLPRSFHSTNRAQSLSVEIQIRLSMSPLRSAPLHLTLTPSHQGNSFPGMAALLQRYSLISATLTTHGSSKLATACHQAPPYQKAISQPIASPRHHPPSTERAVEAASDPKYANNSHILPSNNSAGHSAGTLTVNHSSVVLYSCLPWAAISH